MVDQKFNGVMAEEIVLQCLEHAYDATIDYSTDEKEKQSASAHKAWNTRREMAKSSD